MQMPTATTLAASGLVLWANSFYQTHLEVERKGALHVYRIANQGVAINDKDKVLSQENRAEDNLPTGELERLVPALDDACSPKRLADRKMDQSP